MIRATAGARTLPPKACAIAGHGQRFNVSMPLLIIHPARTRGREFHKTHTVLILLNSRS